MISGTRCTPLSRFLFTTLLRSSIRAHYHHFFIVLPSSLLFAFSISKMYIRKVSHFYITYFVFFLYIINITREFCFIFLMLRYMCILKYVMYVYITREYYLSFGRTISLLFSSHSFSFVFQLLLFPLILIVFIIILQSIFAYPFRVSILNYSFLLNYALPSIFVY